ncbi:hypothetical protein D9M72_433740 [compost metagenome]
MDAVDEHILIVGAVKHAHHAGRGYFLFDPPEEVVGLFLIGGRLERLELHTLRVHGTHDVSHNAALPRRVHSLEDQQDALGAAEFGFGEQLLLEGGKFAVEFGQEGLSVGFAARVPRRGIRIDVGQPESVTGREGSRGVFVECFDS